jgi:hypothetical protein
MTMHRCAFPVRVAALQQSSSAGRFSRSSLGELSIVCLPRIAPLRKQDVEGRPARRVQPGQRVALYRQFASAANPGAWLPWI